MVSGTSTPALPNDHTLRKKPARSLTSWPATASTTSPVRRLARRAGLPLETRATTTLSSTSVALRPSQGRGGWFGRPKVRRSSRMGLRMSIGTIMLSGSGVPLSRTCCTCSEPMPKSSPARPIIAVPPQSLDQPEAGLLIVGQDVTGNRAAIRKMQPDRFRLGDEITDGEYHALADENSVTGALGAQRLCGEGIGGNDGPQPHQRGQRSFEIKGVILRLGLDGMRHLPIARG